MTAEQGVIEATPVDLISAKKAHPMEYSDWRVLGFGTMKIRLDLDDQERAKFELICVADCEEFVVNHENLPTYSYLEKNHVVIPLHSQSVAPVIEFLQNVANEAEIQIPEIAVQKFLRLSNELNMSLDISDRLLGKLENTPLDLIPDFLSKPLWHYQQEGLAWMFRLWSHQLGGILGDEMGVGKTLQLLALACKVSESSFGKPALVVVPGNLLLKWCKDFTDFAAQFAPKVQVHSGPNRSRDADFLRGRQIILTTYSMLVEDQAIFNGIEFSVLVCDEAHELKESKTLRSQAVSSIRAQSKFLATGTPIQNRLQDYWSLLNIVDPGLLGDREQFASILANTPSDARKLMIQTKHRILRRTQEQVGIELPDGIETYVPLELPEDLQYEYEDLKYGVSPYSPPLKGLAAFPKLRQFSAHPRSVIVKAQAQLSPKETFLLDELDQISLAGEKVVVFVADFNDPLDLYLSLVKFEYRNAWVGVIDGRTDLDIRHAMLSRFTEFEGFAVLLVNPQVGGQGLDMVAANHVIHMNPSWNPAKTDQATFRVTRPGQTRKTTTHHLYYVKTIEESIMNLVNSKRELSDAALEEAERDYELNKKTIASIFKVEGASYGRNV